MEVTIKPKSEYPEDCIKVLDKGFVKLVDSMGDDSSIVQAARVSYGKGTKKVSEDEGLIRYLMRYQHTSPFEMVSFKFHIKAPIFVFRQWHRHRTWSYNEYSGRYSVMTPDCYVPKNEHFTRQDPDNKQGGTNEAITLLNMDNLNEWLGDNATVSDRELEEIAKDHSWSRVFELEQDLIHDRYDKLLGTGVRKELARINLPLAQYSEMYATVNLHNLFHFLRLRMDAHAQYEIRVFADAIYELIKPIVPIACQAFEDYRLNGIYFTKNEQVVAAYIIENLHYKNQYDTVEKWFEDIVSGYFKTSREKKEFFTKLEKILEVSKEQDDPKN